jgi:hypothetical protein
MNRVEAECISWAVFIATMEAAAGKLKFSYIDSFFRTN